jgi:hypothetical protein
VCIGTTDDGGYKLRVNGSFYANTFVVPIDTDGDPGSPSGLPWGQMVFVGGSGQMKYLYIKGQQGLNEKWFRVLLSEV